MKLRNKKTGEIVIADITHIVSGVRFDCGQSLAELNEKWEDYEEPEVGYIIDPMEEDCISADDSGYTGSDVERAKELGIWFETEEEAERAVEKLKTYKRLRDRGFRFGGVNLFNRAIDYRLYDENDYPTAEEFRKANDELYEDLELLFGKEEE